MQEQRHGKKLKSNTIKNEYWASVLIDVYEP